MNKSVLKALLFGWCCLVLILCGCSTHLHAQACVGNSCWVPVKPQPKAHRKPFLNVVIPREIPIDYQRFDYRLKSDDQFHSTVCPIHVLYIDQLPEYARQLVLERGMPYFYYDDQTDAYTVGYHDAEGFLKRIKEMRPEARKAAAEKLAREKRERAEREQRERDQAAADAREQRRLEEEEQDRLAEEKRLRREEADRLEQEQREREESEKAEEQSPPPKPPVKKPTIRDELRQGAKLAGKQAFKWALPRLLAAAGFSPDFITVAGITVASGGTAVGMYGAALAIAAGVRWLRKKKAP